MKNFQHLIRLGAIVGTIVVVLLIVRSALTPDTFGQYGAYTGASVERIRNEQTELQYVGTERCKDCHKKEWSKWSRKEHMTVQCEVCHGPGAEHSVEEVEPRPLPMRCPTNGKMLEQVHDLCMSCHSKAPGRSTEFPVIDPIEHLAGFKTTEESEDFEESMRCLNCHTGHDPIKD